MKKLVFIALFGALIAPNYSVKAARQKQAIKQQVEGTAVVEGITVSAVPIQGTDEYLITCTAPEDGVGVLDIFNLAENEYELQPQQIAIVNGQYQYSFKPKPKPKPQEPPVVPLYRIHFWFGGSVVETDIP